MTKDKKNNFSDKLRNFFDYHRDNRPDALSEDTTPTVKRYFKLLGRRFWKLITLNMMMLPMIVPILIAIYVYFSLNQTPTANNVLFPQLFGAHTVSPTPKTTFLLDLFGAQMNVPVLSTGAYIAIGVCILFLLVTFGWQNIGATYVVRNMVRGEPVFIWSDYFYAIKRNLRQALFLGMLDFAVIFFLGFDIVYFWNQTGTAFWTDVYFYVIIALIILYFFMRFYIYLLLVTFDLSIRKVLKNALIFTTLGIKRNLMGLLGIALITFLNVALFFVFGATPLGIAIPLILPFLYYLAVTAFTAAYAAYPIIDRYMIAPYVGTSDEEDEA